MAHIRRLGSGRWQARYRDAERRERASNFRTRAEAQRWLDEQTADLVRGDWRDPRSGRITIGDLAQTWYETTAALKPSTRLAYRSLLDAWVLPRWGGKEVRRIEHGAVAAWAAEVSASTSASTTRKVVGVLRSVLELAVRDRRIPTNPALSVTLPRLPISEQRFLTTAELDALADAMPSERDAVLTLVLGWTGVRFGEAAALRVESIDTLRRRFRIVEAVAEVRGKIVAGTPRHTRRGRSRCRGSSRRCSASTCRGPALRSPTKTADPCESRTGTDARSRRRPRISASFRRRFESTTCDTRRQAFRSRRVPESRSCSSSSDTGLRP